jgi:2-polyprenyl-3-methyl-5-hydroxy-6-metoxy-1,4-benzoquinol methylase
MPRPGGGFGNPETLCAMGKKTPPNDRQETMSKRRKREWFDNDSFWIELYPYMFPETRFAGAGEQIEKALKLAQPNGKVVLDLCCGPGRCAIALAHKGYQVTGVDRTLFLLHKARARARSSKVKIEWVQQDMRDFVRKGAYDLVLSMFTSFGYFDNKQEDFLVLQNMFTSLKSGGVCLIDVVGKEWLAKVLQPTRSELMPDGSMLIQRHEIFDDWTRIRNEWIVLRGGRAKRFKFHHTIYSGQELRDRLAQAGFREIRLYGNLDGQAYDLNAQRLIAVGHKHP